MSQAGSDVTAKDGALLPAGIRDAQRNTLLLSFGLLSILLMLLVCPGLQPLASAEKLDSAQPAAQSSMPNVAAQASMQQPAAVSSQPLESRLPFYQTWYFYLALLFLGITLPVQIFRRRMLLMKGRIGIVVEERNRISRECHDTLMAGFAAISWQLEATAKLFRDSGLESTPAAESCELARSMVSHCQAEARRIIWDLRETDEVTSILSQALDALACGQSRSGQDADHARSRRRGDPSRSRLRASSGLHRAGGGYQRHAPRRRLAHSRPCEVRERRALSLHSRRRQRIPALRIAPHRADGHFGIAVMQERVRKIGGVFRIHAAGRHRNGSDGGSPFNATEELVHQGQNVIRWIGI